MAYNSTNSYGSNGVFRCFYSLPTFKMIIKILALF
jgi:hypothetical protein